MAGLRVGLLVVLAGLLFLDSVWCWEWISSDKQQNFYGAAEWGEQLRSPSDALEYDEYEAIPEDELPERKGEATSDGYSHSSVRHSFPVEGEHFGSRNRVSGTGRNFQVDFNAPPRTWSDGSSPRSAWLDVVCSDTDFQITLLKGQLSNVHVLGSDNLLPVMDAPKSCGYRTDLLKNTLTVPFTGCNVKSADDYTLQLLYSDKLAQTQVATASCERGLKDLDSRLPHPRALPLLISFSATPASLPAQSCSVSSGEQVTCGGPGISSSDCKTMGCCVDSSTAACYYPLDVCTTDQQFVFAIRFNTAAVNIDPTKLAIPGTNCKPIVANDKVAIFKFKVTECGVRAYTIGTTTIYMARVQSAVNVLDLKYGIITRADPLRFMIECRYSQRGNDQELLVSTGYMVKTPPSILPTTVMDTGLYAVQLRLATDQTYTSYFPSDHPPLQLLLGKPVYLELNLVTPKPQAVILVNYCLAYPLSAKNALVLIYEGCANPYDPNVSVLKVIDLPQNRHQRRFVVTAFQFMDQKTNLYLNEDIYFMCSTEVCRPTERTCQDQCFDG